MHTCVRMPACVRTFTHLCVHASACVYVCMCVHECVHVGAVSISDLLLLRRLGGAAPQVDRPYEAHTN